MDSTTPHTYTAVLEDRRLVTGPLNQLTVKQTAGWPKDVRAHVLQRPQSTPS